MSVAHGQVAVHAGPGCAAHLVRPRIQSYVGMGILPLQFERGQSADSLGLDGSETYDLVGLAARFGAEDSPTGGTVDVVATRADGATVGFKAVVRIDTPAEADYYRNGGILNYVLRRLAR